MSDTHEPVDGRTCHQFKCKCGSVDLDECERVCEVATSVLSSAFINQRALQSSDHHAIATALDALPALVRECREGREESARYKSKRLEKLADPEYRLAYIESQEESLREICAENTELRAERERLAREVDAWRDRASRMALDNTRLRAFEREFCEASGAIVEWWKQYGPDVDGAEQLALLHGGVYGERPSLSSLIDSLDALREKMK